MVNAPGGTGTAFVTAMNFQNPCPLTGTFSFNVAGALIGPLLSGLNGQGLTTGVASCEWDSETSWARPVDAAMPMASSEVRMVFIVE